MATYVHKLQEEVKQNKLSSEEKQKLKSMSERTSTSDIPLVYKLKFPANVIPITTERGPLSILKAPSVVATIGTFDPDTNPKANFKDTWERIQNYTRNYQLYEHEYIDILMILMKGESATHLTDMISSYGSDLSKILTALQDIYVPCHTIFDEMDELNKFSRPANENIKTTIRRAGLLINKLRHTCSSAAWEERRYHMMLALIKQVIAKETSQHLYSEELKCAQMGKQLDMPAIISILTIHEQSNPHLIPKRELKLTYNINSMQLIQHESDKSIKTMTVADKEKGHQLSKNRNSNDRNKTPDRKSRIDKSSDRMKTNYNKNVERTTRSSSKDTYQNSQRNSQGDRNYRSTSPYSNRSQSGERYRSNNSRERYTPSRSRERERERYRSKSNESQRSYGNDRQNYKQNNKSKDRNNKPRNNNGKNDRPPNGQQRKYNKTFEHGKNQVILHFYKCEACPNMHPTGINCDKSHEISSLNA